MGIDCYARWDGMTEADKQAQYTGFSIVHGHAGYLREAYHGGPYATRALLPEAFDEALEAQYPDGVPIDAARLEKRLPAVLNTVIARARRVYDYDETDPEHAAMLAREQESYRAFVALCRRKQEETGTPTRIIASY